MHRLTLHPSTREHEVRMCFHLTKTAYANPGLGLTVPSRVALQALCRDSLLLLMRP